MEWFWIRLDWRNLFLSFAHEGPNRAKTNQPYTYKLVEAVVAVAAETQASNDYFTKNFQKNEQLDTDSN